MDSLRFDALKLMNTRSRVETVVPDEKISNYFGVDVFGKEQMRQYLSKDVFASVMDSINEGTRIDRKVADQVAEGMKVWAMSRGATHYTHWFQPLNDSTAEKHDAFLTINSDGSTFESFSGNLLVQQEPDASSFPSGGLRNTFEARGYSAWDPSSPAFVIDKTLCIPSIFVSYNGDALDFKTPLLRSMSAIDKASVRVCQLFDKDVTRVVPNLGWEQEYFLIDEALYNARPDLVQTGRTLMGHTAAKDQQLEDHYWGTIPQRVSDFMKDCEQQCYRLGVPIKTRHNEVAPNQFECAPMYEEANIAVDHNVLLMSIMKKTAQKHHLKVLFHERPFNGINGSGKHCNWSLSTNTGVNLLSPGKNPKSNIQFLSFYVCVLKAAKDFGSLMMASIASQSNSFRLGGNEAPPAILSVFTGSTMSKMLSSITNSLSNAKLTPDQKSKIKLHIGKIPEILLDNTDRNRTSPFAFTGNRFEFRAPGSSCNCAMPIIAVDTAVAYELDLFRDNVDKLIDKGVKKDEAILQVIKDFIIESEPVRFEGNGYSAEWHKEAVKRGLKSIDKAFDAFGEYLLPDAVALFKKYSVFSKTELDSRYEIKVDTLLKKIQIESRVTVDIAMNHIVPTAIKYQNVLIENIRGIKEIFPNDIEKYAGREIETLSQVALLSNNISTAAVAMTEARKKLNKIESIPKRAREYENTIVPMMERIRESIDKLEMIVDDEYWPLIKYRELLARL
ncbi:MAG: glutamine synthetase III [Bacteroidales bacterium]|nr:glutamine synthetase III [Bacteroidales bacterium]